MSEPHATSRRTALEPLTLLNGFAMNRTAFYTSENIEFQGQFSEMMIISTSNAQFIHRICTGCRDLTKGNEKINETVELSIYGGTEPFARVPIRKGWDPLQKVKCNPQPCKF